MIAFIRSVFTLALALTLQGCLSNPTAVEVIDHPAPEEDKKYSKALSSATIEAGVYANFETNLLITATHLSPQFTASFGERIKTLLDTVPFSVEQGTNKTGFFISVFTPERAKADLTNETLWNLSLEVSGKKHVPVAIKKINEKVSWKAFFPAINPWTSEYFVVFDVQNFNPGDPTMVQKQTAQLKLSGVDSGITLKW